MKKPGEAFPRAARAKNALLRSAAATLKRIARVAEGYPPGLGIRLKRKIPGVPRGFRAKEDGAGDRIRTGDVQLGKLTFYP
jgi:hypothetical protein